MGGATHSALTLIKHMRQKGNDVIVVIPTKDDSFISILKAFDVQVYVVKLCFMAYPLCVRKMDYIRWPYYLIKTLLLENSSKKELEEIIRNEHVDIVHSNNGPIVCGYEVCNKLGIPHIWHIREYGDKDFNIWMFPSKKVFRQWLSKSYVISITKDLIKYNQLEGNVKAQVIYNGVRKKCDIHNDYPKDKYFICASRISKEKGFCQIIRVFSKFHELYSDHRLKIIGIGIIDYIEQLKNMAERLNVISFIDFEGYKDNVSDYMAHATALLVASPYEGFGRMTAEAAFAGCLVVGKNTAGTKEILEITGGYPFITDDEMLEAMVTVCNLTEEEYRDKASYAQKQAILNFSEETYVNQVHNLYLSVL